MRVLQLGKYYYPFRGGIETHLQLLCGELKSAVELDVVVCNTQRARAVDRIEGVSVTRCPELARVASTSICPTMPLELAKRRYDVIHFHFPHPVGAMSYLACRPSHPHAVVVTYHADIVKQRRLLVAYRPFLRMLLDRADAIICASPSYRDSSAELSDYRQKTHVIPYGIDLAALEANAAVRRAAAAIRARVGGSIILGVGRLVPYKGFEFLVRAMRGVQASLLIVGTGPLRESLERLAREVGVANRVHFVGHTDDVTLRAHYEACDVFALPSVDRSEAFALVQLEAMAASRPVVNTAIRGSGVPWVSRDGESGLTVAPRDETALASALQCLLDDRELAGRLGQRGRARVEREFTKRAMADQTLALYRELTPFLSEPEAHSDCAPIASYRNP